MGKKAKNCKHDFSHPENSTDCITALSYTKFTELGNADFYTAPRHFADNDIASLFLRFQNIRACCSIMSIAAGALLNEADAADFRITHSAVLAGCGQFTYIRFSKNQKYNQKLQMLAMRSVRNHKFYIPF